ncbi:MAG: cytidylyltransferase [Gammaproteobacteria bacterium]
MAIELIQEIHKSNFRFVIVTSGGGSIAVSDLLSVPGASNSVLETYTPYARESLAYYLLREPDQYCSMATTLSMAAKAFSAAKKIDKNSSKHKLLGIGVTASLKSIAPKKGNHRFYIAIQTQDYSKTISCILNKDQRSRIQEEQVISDVLIQAIREACNLSFEFPNLEEELLHTKVIAEKDWLKVMDEKINFVSAENRIPEIIFPGSFNPLHEGHIAMKDLAEDRTGMQVSFEICIQNADKPPLSYHEIQRTLEQFKGQHHWIITKQGRFSEKAAMFPNSVFIIGADTLLRILNEKFYLNHKDMMSQLDLFNHHNINFLVFGRYVNHKFHTLNNISLPEHIRARFTGFDEKIFRNDISSTTIRKLEDPEVYNS